MAQQKKAGKKQGGLFKKTIQNAKYMLARRARLRALQQKIRENQERYVQAGSLSREYNEKILKIWHKYGRGVMQLQQLEEKVSTEDIQRLILLLENQTKHLLAVQKWVAKAHEYGIPFEWYRYPPSEELPQLVSNERTVKEVRPIFKDETDVNRANQELRENRHAIQKLKEILAKRREK